MRVLVVDDDPATRFGLKRLLVREFESVVTEATNGLEALEILSTSQQDLMLLDLQMPVMDGFETLRAVRRSAPYRALPVVVMSAVKDEVPVRHVIELGISDYLAKPLSSEQVRTRLWRTICALEQSDRSLLGGAAPERRARTPIVIADDDAE